MNNDNLHSPNEIYWESRNKIILFSIAVLSLVFGVVDINDLAKSLNIPQPNANSFTLSFIFIIHIFLWWGFFISWTFQHQQVRTLKINGIDFLAATFFTFFTFFIYISKLVIVESNYLDNDLDAWIKSFMISILFSLIITFLLFEFSTKKVGNITAEKNIHETEDTFKSNNGSTSVSTFPLHNLLISNSWTMAYRGNDKTKTKKIKFMDTNIGTDNDFLGEVWNENDHGKDNESFWKTERKDEGSISEETYLIFYNSAKQEFSRFKYLEKDQKFVKIESLGNKNQQVIYKTPK